MRWVCFFGMSRQCLGLFFDILGGIENLASKTDHFKNIYQFQMLAYMQHKVLELLFYLRLPLFLSQIKTWTKNMSSISKNFTELFPKYQ